MATRMEILSAGLSIETRMAIAKGYVRNAKIMGVIAAIALIVLVLGLILGASGAFGIHLSFGWCTIFFGIALGMLLGGVVFSQDARDLYQTISDGK